MNTSYEFKKSELLIKLLLWGIYKKNSGDLLLFFRIKAFFNEFIQMIKDVSRCSNYVVCLKLNDSLNIN